MKISCLPKKGDRFIWTVYLDDEPWIDFHTKIFGTAPLLPSCETLEQFREMFIALEYTKAKKYAMDRLAMRSYPSAQLQKLLERNLISSNNIQKILLEFKKQGYLNDEEWIERFVKGQILRHNGPQMIIYKLMSKGISQKKAGEWIEKILNDDDAKKSIQHLLETKYKKRNLSDFKEKQKVIAALARKGFDLETIRSTLN